MAVFEAIPGVTRRFGSAALIACVMGLLALGEGEPTVTRGTQRPMETLLSLRWKGIVHQHYDYSCGTGSIENLMAFLGKPAPDEITMIKKYAEIFGIGRVKHAQEVGFSLLDLKRMLGVLGYPSEGVRYEAATLPDTFQPMIVYLVVRGYRHFAVFAGIEANQVVLLDSARGHIRVTIDRFLAEWDGTALLLDESLTQSVHLPDDRHQRTAAEESLRRCLQPAR